MNTTNYELYTTLSVKQLESIEGVKSARKNGKFPTELEIEINSWSERNEAYEEIEEEVERMEEMEIM